MKHAVFTGLTFLLIFSLFSVDVNAVGLQEYLQSTDSGQVSQTALTADSAANPSEGSSLFTHVIELVVAGIVASALIISLLVLFLGRWAGNKEKKKIKSLRINAEKEKDHITSAVATVRQQEKETTKLVHNIKNHVAEFTTRKELADKHDKSIQESAERIKAQEKELTQVAEHISLSMNKIQSYWDAQLRDTVDTIHQVQQGLDSSLAKVDAELDTMQQQKKLSQELLQDFLDRHNEQSELINKNSEVSEEVSKKLQETLTESTQLVNLLKKHQENAEKSLNNFTSELTNYEEQAYEQFDTSFQVADLARQELNANIEESRKHIETMRRHEQQSHNINAQTQKNLEALDYSKILKLSNTLDSTQDMFSDIQTKVDDAKHMLDELRDIEVDIKETASSVEGTVKNQTIKIEKPAEDNVLQENTIEEKPQAEEALIGKLVDKSVEFEAEYKMASGDNTPISFFKSVKKK